LRSSSGFAARSKQLASNFKKITLRKSRRPGHFWRNLIIGCLIAGTVGMIMIVGLFFYYSRGLPTMDEVRSGAVAFPESTKIYDRTGTHLLYTIHGEENRTRITLSQIPDYVKWATIATEDQDFYTRSMAIDIKGLGRAVWSVIKNHSLAGPGGSTITQQLVRNIVLTREKTIARKIKEIILSFKIEQAFTRDEILALYLNQIPYGSNAYGIEQAAATFFGKSAKDLTLAQAALIAVLTKATTYYSPFGTHVDQLLARQKTVLKQMLDEGYINEEEWNQAKNEELKFSSQAVNMDAPHFVIYIKELLAHRYGEIELEQGGLKITTTLDYDLQKIAESAVAEGALANDAGKADNAALVAIDPTSGQILTMVGSRDYFDETHKGNFNVATAPRQPGSSFKPFVYTALFTKGYSPNTILFDVITDFAPRADQEYIPKDFDGRERGPVSIRTALAGSLNVPAVKALYLAGLNTVSEYAGQLGYTTLSQTEKMGLSLALGGGEVKLLEHTAAFGVLANDGVRQETTAILKVEKPDGKVLEEFAEAAGVRVFPENAVRMVTSILSDTQARIPVFGDNKNLKLGDIPVAVKTGTTNDFRDAWTVGYTPSLVAGVWVGRNDNQEMKSTMDGSKAAAPIWHQFMLKALAGKKIERFTKPQITETGKPVIDGTIKYTRLVKLDKISGKLATPYTPPEMIQEVEFSDYHCILYHVDRADPLGASPTDPAIDPQFANWEAAVSQWAMKMATGGAVLGGTATGAAQIFKAPPTEFDDVHLPGEAPEVEIISPLPLAVINSASLYIDVKVSAKRSLVKVEYYIDGMFRESAGGQPYSRVLFFGSLPDGLHKISVKAYDAIGNVTVKEVDISIGRVSEINPPDSAANKPQARIIFPSAGAEIASAAFPLSIKVELTSPQMVRQVNLYYNDKNGNPIMIESRTADLEPEVFFSWLSAPEAGSYLLYTILIDQNGDSSRGEINVTIQ